MLLLTTYSADTDCSQLSALGQKPWLPHFIAQVRTRRSACVHAGLSHFPAQPSPQPTCAHTAARPSFPLSQTLCGPPLHAFRAILRAACTHTLHRTQQRYSSFFPLPRYSVCRAHRVPAGLDAWCDNYLRCYNASSWEGGCQQMGGKAGKGGLADPEIVRRQLDMQVRAWRSRGLGCESGYSVYNWHQRHRPVKGPQGIRRGRAGDPEQMPGEHALLSGGGGKTWSQPRSLEEQPTWRAGSQDRCPEGS